MSYRSHPAENSTESLGETPLAAKNRESSYRFERELLEIFVEGYMTCHFVYQNECQRHENLAATFFSVAAFTILSLPLRPPSPMLWY